VTDNSFVACEDARNAADARWTDSQPLRPQAIPTECVLGDSSQTLAAYQRFTLVPRLIKALRDPSLRYMQADRAWAISQLTESDTEQSAHTF
tara:strand:- start:178 stop:453 length:276 start_codon:yes stop_codon:yes gene_type:complete